MATHCSILPGESHGKRSLVGYSPLGWQESDRTQQLHHHHQASGGFFLFLFLFFQSVITKYLCVSHVKELCSPGAYWQILVILITDLEFNLPSDLGSKKDINTTSQLNFIIEQQKHLLLNYASIKLLEKCLGFGPFPYSRPDVCQEQGRSASVQTQKKSPAELGREGTIQPGGTTL